MSNAGLITVREPNGARASVEVLAAGQEQGWRIIAASRVGEDHQLLSDFFAQIAQSPCSFRNDDRPSA
ncbi:hypothetical protein BFW01_g8629 [Lasiodiplodia theobromae]|nr:hypothetical protein BFW01_g8629 [Lasiodiplodia theobromae]